MPNFQILQVSKATRIFRLREIGPIYRRYLQK